jgi:subtilase family serine protease
MARRVALALLVSLAGTMSAVMATQPQPTSRPSAAPIRLRAGTFSPVRGDAPPLAGDALLPSSRASDPAEYIVQFQGPVLEVWKAGVSEAGATLLEYLPDFAFRVRMRAQDAAQVRRLPFVAWVGAFHPDYKLPAQLAAAGERPVVVRLDRDADVDAVNASLQSSGARVSRLGPTLLMVTARPDQARALARIRGVAGVEPFALRVKHNEFGGGLILGSRLANDSGYDGSSQIVAVADTGLGAGFPSGAHADIPAARVRSIVNRPGVPDFCFETIVDDGAADVDTGHGTHVATAVLGAGNAAGVGRGTAPGAELVFQAIENYAVPSLLCNLLYGIPEGYYLVGLPGDLQDLYQQAYDAGARIHSDSWGAAVAGAYTAEAESTDAFMWARRDMAIVFSSGNSGVDADGNGLVDSGSVGSPGTAKNVITVGASENDRRSEWQCDPSLGYTTCAAQGGQNALFTYGSSWPGSFPVNPLRDDPSAGNAEQMAAFSSRGPTQDGRIKPDVVAPGTWTLSGYSSVYQQQYDASPNPQTGVFQYDGWGFPLDPSYKYMGGTSMAAPLGAGGAAVARDFYQKARGHQASAALIKATLINSAVDLLDENNDGLLDNAQPIPNPHEGWGRVDLANATDNTQQFSDEAAPLVTGATATYTFAIEHDRPLKTTLAWTDYPSSPSAAVNLVNDLDLVVTAPDGTTYRGNVFQNGWSTGSGAPDRVNNVENVYLPDPAAGTWTVTVSGYNVPMGPQRFALVVDNGPAGTGQPLLRASVDDGTATEAGPTGGGVRVMRTGETAGPLTVTYAVTGTATSGDDYAALTGQVTIPDGSDHAIVVVNALDDDLIEPNETVTITLVSDSTYAVGSPASATVTIASDDLPPDLVVSSVVAPAWVAAGSAIAVSDTTRNQGTVAAPASETGFYLSANTTLEPTDTFLGARTVGALAAGATASGTSTLDIPASTSAGVYFVVAHADWAGHVDETSNANNTRTSGSVRIGPDLIVSAIGVPASTAAGESFVVSDTTRNQGAGSASSTLTRFYLSTNSAWDAADLPLGEREAGTLAGGASATASTTLVVPGATAPGTYYLIARADAADALAEVAENNNLRSGVLRVGADLLVSAIAGPGAAAAGDTISITESTANSGGAEVSESTTAFYLSANTTLGPGDVRLASRLVPGLDAGASSTAAVALSLPPTTVAGTYYVLARADDLNEVVETSEANNLRASGALKVGPDLTVVTVTVPTFGEPGGILSVTDTVKNQGGAATPLTERAFYLSANTSLDASDVELARGPVPPLAASASHSATESLLLPASLVTGSYYVLSVADPANAVAETVESNNVRASAAFKIGPDLVVSALTSPTRAPRGATITITETTRNQGGSEAGGSITRYYLSSNGALDAGDVPLGSRTVAALAPGGFSAITMQLTIPSGTATGSHYVIARTDDGNAVVEVTETNNTRAASLRVDP